MHFWVLDETQSPGEKGAITVHSSGHGTELAVHWSQAKITHLSRYYSQILLEVGQKLNKSYPVIVSVPYVTWPFTLLINLPGKDFTLSAFL